MNDGIAPRVACQQRVHEHQRQQQEHDQRRPDHPQQQRRQARPSDDARRILPACTPSGASHSVECGTNGQKARRPKIVSSAGRSVSIESAAQATPMAPIGPSPEVPFTFAIVRQSSAAITVAADANTAGPADRIAGRHRLVPVQRVVKLLPISGDDQQGVVGARAEHQDGHDRARLAVDRHAELRDAVADRAGEDLGEYHGRQRDEQEDRRAVDQDQQDDHERHRGEQQGAVDGLEDLDRVRGVAGAAGDLHLEAAARIRHRVAPELDRVEDRVAVAVALQVGGHDRRLAVRGADRAHERRVVARLARDLRGRPSAALG